MFTCLSFVCAVSWETKIKVGVFLSRLRLSSVFRRRLEDRLYTAEDSKQNLPTSSSMCVRRFRVSEGGEEHRWGW